MNATEIQVKVTDTKVGKSNLDIVEIDGEIFARIGATYYTLCWKCNGVGYLSGYEFIDNARCWTCSTLGVTHNHGTLADVTKAAKRRKTNRAAAARRAERKAAEKSAENAAAKQEWRDANPELAVTLDAIVAATAEAQPHSDDLTLTELAGRACTRGLSPKQTAFVASLLAERDDAEAARAERETNSAWLGEIKERITVTVTLTKAIAIDDYYARYEGATKPLYLFVTPEGNELKWFASSWVLDVKEGDTITLTGTVKNHETSEREFNKGQKITVLTRCKVAK